MENLLKSNIEIIEFLLKTLPWILLIMWALYSIITLGFNKFSERFSNFYIIESIPSVFVTLGLFGTFMGISYGLLYFNTAPDQIKESIKILLDGLKLAMFTSITGILLSLIFSKIIKIKVFTNKINPPISPELEQLIALNNKFDNFNKDISKTQHDALLEALKKVLENFDEVLFDLIDELVKEKFDKLTETIDQINQWQRYHKDDVNNMIKTYRELVNQHTKFVNKTDSWIKKIDKVSGQSSKLQTVINQFNEAFNEDGNLSNILNEIHYATAELKSTTEHFEAISSKMNYNTDKIEITGDKITEWTESIKTVQRLETGHIDNLVNKLNNELSATFSTLDSLMKTYIEDLKDRAE